MKTENEEKHKYWKVDATKFLLDFDWGLIVLTWILILSSFFINGCLNISTWKIIVLSITTALLYAYRKLIIR